MKTQTYQVIKKKRVNKRRRGFKLMLSKHTLLLKNLTEKMPKTIKSKNEELYDKRKK